MDVRLGGGGPGPEQLRLKLQGEKHKGIGSASLFPSIEHHVE